jgi:hypothetical protein
MKMDIATLPKTLTYNQVKALRAAYGHFYDEEQGSKFADKATGFRFENVTKFVDYLYSPEIGIPKGTSAKVIGITLESWYETLSKAPEFSEPTMTAAPEYAAPSNTLSPEQLAQFQKEAGARVESFKKSQADAKIAIEAAIKKQQELAEITKNAKVYVKVKSPTPAKLTNDQEKSIDTLKTAAKANPQKLTDEIAATIEEKIGPSIPKEVTKEEAALIYKQTACRVVSNLQGNSLAEESVIQNGISVNKSILPKIIPAEDTRAAFSFSASETANPKILEYVLTRSVASAAFGESFANNVFGPENLSAISVQFSNSPRSGFTPYDLSQIPNQYSSFLESQSSFLGSFKNFAEGEIKSQLLSQAGNWLSSQVASLPADSFLAQTFNSEVVQGALSYFGLGSPIAWEGTTFFGRIAIQNGFGPALGWAQNLTGINFGISKAVSAVTSEVVGNAAATTAATTVGTEVVAGTVGATAGAGAGVAIGQVVVPIPVVGAAIGAAVSWVVSKIAKLIPPETLKKWSGVILGGLAGLVALPFVGIGAALGIGIGTTAISAGLGAGVGGATLAGIGAGIGGFFAALGGAFLGAIGMPILVTLLVFPVVVAFILFIINSGAYIVPPTSTTAVTENPYIGIDKTATPAGPFQNSQIPITVEYTVTVTAKKGTLTNITFSDECNVFKKNSPPPCPQTEGGVPTAPLSITPDAPFTFKYKMNISSGNYNDSAIINTLNVSADVDGQMGVLASGGASVIIGNPPTGCLKMDNSWPDNYKSIAQSLILQLSSKYPAYMAKVCSAGVAATVTFSQVCPLGWVCYGAFLNGKIYLMPQAFSSQNYAFFTLAHETGHFFQYTTSLGNSLYLQYRSTISPPDICSYRNTFGNYDESFAETIGRYASNESSGCFAGSFRASYPTNWQFANDKIFK